MMSSCPTNVNITCVIQLGSDEVFRCQMKDCYLGDCITEILRLRAIDDHTFHSFTYHDEEKNRYNRGFLDRDKPIQDLSYLDILDYPMMITWYERIKIKHHTKFRKRIANCFDVLIKPISSFVSFSWYTKENKTVFIKLANANKTTMLTYDIKEQLIKLLAWNQDCDILTYRLMSKCILNYSIRHEWRGLSLRRRLDGYNRKRFKKDLNECFNYHYYAWGRLYYILLKQDSNDHTLFVLIANSLKELCFIDAYSSFITYQIPYCSKDDEGEAVPELVSPKSATGIDLGSLLGFLHLSILIVQKNGQ